MMDINDAYMFMKVTVPYDNITVVAGDGTKAAAKADTELFSYDVKSGWIEIGTPVKDTNNKTVTHLYAYGTATQMTAVAANQKTGTLFDWVKFVNAREVKDWKELQKISRSMHMLSRHRTSMMARQNWMVSTPMVRLSQQMYGGS